MPLIFPQGLRISHTAPVAPTFLVEGTDTTSPMAVNLSPTINNGDLMFAMVASDSLPVTHTINTPAANGSGPWTALFNGAPSGGTGQWKFALFAKVATGTESVNIQFNTSGAAFSTGMASVYKVDVGNHAVVTPATDIQVVTNEVGPAAGSGQYPAVTVPNNERLIYIGNYNGNNGNAYDEDPIAGTTAINTNGFTDNQEFFLDVTDQSTPGPKSAIPVTFSSANAEQVFFAITYP